MKNILIIIALFVSFGLNAQVKEIKSNTTTSINVKPSPVADGVSQIKTFMAIKSDQLDYNINQFLKQPGIKLESISYAVVRSESDVAISGGEHLSAIVAYHTESK